MVYEIMLKMGVPLTYPVIPIEIGGAAPKDAKKGYSIGDDCMLLVCLAEGITVENIEAMADYAPAKIIAAESSFADDTIMSNAYYILRDKGIELKLVRGGVTVETKIQKSRFPDRCGQRRGRLVCRTGKAVQHFFCFA